jgi:hypothetical protein
MDFEGYAWAAVTQDVVPLGDWFPDLDVHGHSSLAMGRRVCLSFDMMGGGITFSVVKGTAYKQWDDGQLTRSDDFGAGAGDPDLPEHRRQGPAATTLNLEMAGDDLPALAATVRDWSGQLVDARPATNEELALTGSETGNGSNASALVMPDDPRSVLVVMAECGSDETVEVTITADRLSVLLVAGSRTDCDQPGARRGAVLTFESDVPADIEAFTGL